MISVVLILNIGSSSIKWSTFNSLTDVDVLAEGRETIDNMSTCVAGLLHDLEPSLCIIRFVHGGTKMIKPREVTLRTVKSLDDLVEFAPIHNRLAVDCIRLILSSDNNMRIIAVFDTEFFQNLPRVARMYGLPQYLIQKHGIRRFGFHGFAHASMLNILDEIAAKSFDTAFRYSRVITIQLGSGCSMAAIRNGIPIETSMGFSPNEGLLMSSRCGDIDASLVTWLQKKESWTPEETDRILNEQSGWKGFSGLSGDMRQLLESDSDSAKCAIDLFVYRIKKTIGAYYALLGGLDAVAFGGGISEHAPELCRRIMDKSGHLGVVLLSEVGSGSGSSSAPPIQLTQDDSNVACWVVMEDEAKMMMQTVFHSGIAREIM